MVRFTGVGIEDRWEERTGGWWGPDLIVREAAPRYGSDIGDRSASHPEVDPFASLTVPVPPDSFADPDRSIHPDTADAPDPFADLDSLLELEDEIRSLSVQIHAATHRLLLLIAEFDRRRGWEVGGHRSCADWLSFRTGIDRGAARERVRAAKALEDLPRTSETMSRGELSFSQVRALTRVATAANEEELLDFARDNSASRLERLVRGWKGRSNESDTERDERLHVGLRPPWIRRGHGLRPPAAGPTLSGCSPNAHSRRGSTRRPGRPSRGPAPSGIRWCSMWRRKRCGVWRRSGVTAGGPDIHRVGRAFPRKRVPRKRVPNQRRAVQSGITSASPQKKFATPGGRTGSLFPRKRPAAHRGQALSAGDRPAGR